MSELVRCKDCGNQVSPVATICPQCGRPVSPQTTPTTWTVLLFIVLAVIVWSMAHDTGSSAPYSPPKTSPAAALTTPAERETIEANGYVRGKVQVKNFEWQRGGFDTVIVADLTIKNNGDRPIRDIGLRCETFGESSDTVISEPKLTLYETVRAGKSRRFYHVNFGYAPQQVKRAACIADAIKFAD